MMAERFHVDPNSWLGCRLGSGKLEVCQVKEALRFECVVTKGDDVREDVRSALEAEMVIIKTLPGGGLALRGDKVEKARAKEMDELQRPSVDVFVDQHSSLLLVECKYKAQPETQIVGSLSSFNSEVGRKFEASLDFLRAQGVEKLNEERIVLFNAISKEVAYNAFCRLRVQAEGALDAYVVMNSEEFGNKYLSAELSMGKQKVEDSL